MTYFYSLLIGLTFLTINTDKPFTDSESIKTPTELCVDFGDGIYRHTLNTDNINWVMSNPELFKVTGTMATVIGDPCGCGAKLGEDVSKCNISWGIFVKWCYARAEKNAIHCVNLCELEVE